MQWSEERIEGAVSERGFEVTGAGEAVPGVLWRPPGPVKGLILVGHGGGQNRRGPIVLGFARRFPGLGYAVAAIDAPGHGDRRPLDPKPRSAEEAMAAMKALTPVAVADWRAALDGLQEHLGAGPVGYVGLSLGTGLGLPFVAEEPRITAAVLGLAGVRSPDDLLAVAAAKITAPVQFMLQWDDELVPRDAGLALFDAIGSAEKTLHANRGGHGGIPMFERSGYEAFFARHLK